MGEKPFDEVKLQGSQILFILAVLSLLDSSPRDHVGLSPEGARKGDGTNPRHTQTHADTASTPSPHHKLNIIYTQDWGGSAKIIQSSPLSPERLNSEQPTVLTHSSPQTCSSHGPNKLEAHNSHLAFQVHVWGLTYTCRKKKRLNWAILVLAKAMIVGVRGGSSVWATRASRSNGIQEAT